MTADVIRFPKAAAKESALIVNEQPRRRQEEVVKVTVPLESMLLEFCASADYMKHTFMQGVRMRGALGFDEQHRDRGFFPLGHPLIQMPAEFQSRSTFEFQIDPERDGSLGYSFRLKSRYLDRVFWLSGEWVGKLGSKNRYIRFWWDCPHCGGRRKPVSLYIRLSDFWIGCANCSTMPKRYLEFYSVKKCGVR